MAKKDKLEIHHPQPIDYPNLTIWKTDIPEKDKLKIINPEDFPLSSILSGISVERSSLASSFGITDAEEIKERQNVMRFLSQNPKIEKWINKDHIDFNFPSHEKQFLGYFSPDKAHTPYWERIGEFVEMLEKAKPLPVRINALLEMLKKSMVLEADEKILSQFAIERITNIAVIEGFIDFNAKLGYVTPDETTVKKDCEDKDCDYIAPISLEEYSDYHLHGHRMFSFAVTAAAKHTDPSWVRDKNNPFNWIGIGDLAKMHTKWQNQREERKAFDQMVINKMSGGLLYDIKNGVLKKLQSFNWGTFSKNDNAKIKVYFSYSSKGLRLRIYGIVPKAYIELPDFEFKYSEYYSDAKIEEISKALKEYCTDAKDFQLSILAANKMTEINDKISNLFKTEFSADSPETDREHRWFALSNILADPSISEIHEESLRHRKYVEKHMNILSKITYISMQMKKRAKELGTQLSFAEIIEDGKHVISFDELFPIHLLPQLFNSGEKPVPITGLAPIDGQIIGLTGSNGGGKTVAALSISDNIYIAQSGLPVFGKNFKLNPKKILGLVFIERGKGSTCQVLVDKHINVCEAIKHTDGGEVVLILDELGSATQESAGFELGRDLLTTFAEKNVSVIFTTQITTLAEYAINNLKGVCYKFNLEHHMSSGIGDGDLDKLREKMGLNKYLKKTK